MKARSAKNKGLRFENFILGEIRQELDRAAYLTPSSGAGLDRNDIRIPNFDIEAELKNQKTVTITQDFEQLERQTMPPNRGVLIVRNPKKPEFEQSFVIMDLCDWLELEKHQKAEVETTKSFPREHRWLIERTVDSLKKCLRIFE